MKYYTDQDTIQYVGHSNGCRVALSALEQYQNTGKTNVAKVKNLQTGNFVTVNLQGSAPAPIVDTFIGIGCPGAFEGDSLFISCIQQHGQAVLDYFTSIGKTHISNEEFIHRLGDQAGMLSLCYLLSLAMGGSSDSISLNLGEDYLFFIQSTSEPQPGSFTVNRSAIIYGTDGLTLDQDDDTVVTEEDAIAIHNTINANNKWLNATFLHHQLLPNALTVKDIIIRRLNQ